MSEKSRIFGNNLQVFLKEKGMQPEHLAERLGYSVQEVRRMMDARLSEGVVHKILQLT